MNRQGSKHLTFQERKIIEQLLQKRLSCKEIALQVGKDDRTVSREVKYRRIPRENGKYGLYGKKDKTECKSLNRFPYTCNGCTKRASCFRKCQFFYNSSAAQEDYESLLKESREGIDLTEEAFDKLNRVMTSGVDKGQSVNHIVNTSDDILCSARTVYRYIDEGKLDVKPIDLRRKVKFKPRKRYIQKEDNKKIRIGRKYADFLRQYALENPISITEIDTVESKSKGNHKCLLTVHFTGLHFMLIYVLDSKTKKNVSLVFYRLREELGMELFKKLFHITLTDRGTEFCEPDAIELDFDTGEKVCNLYYCDSYSSYQKGSIEENHELIRYVIPKGTVFDNLTQEQCNLMASHINSYRRETVDATPYELAFALFGDEFLEKTKTRLIEPDLVLLKPSLLK